ncbi:MAG: helicase-related protein [Streptosporangiaceae bacterium]
MAELFEPGQRVQLPHGTDGWLTVDFARPGPAGGWIVYLLGDQGDSLSKVSLTADEAARVKVLVADGGGSSPRALAGMWTCWMAAATADASVSALSSSPLRPYAHQANAVYGAMLPQPWLRFLLADEPGTGKTVMAGLYLREMRRLGLVNRALVVAPAGLVSKWQADFDRFFGGGLRRITAGTVREHALELGHDVWIVSLELAAVNAAVQEAIRPDRAGWDLVIFDEAHRLTATAHSFHRVGKLLAGGSPRALLMTATPHRGSEWLFRHLLHLVDPEVYPDPGDDPKRPLTALRPGSIHFLRRMKEDLVDYDGVTKLFKRRHAINHRIPLSPIELDIYERALEVVDRFFAPQARPLARMVYGKRAASSLHALAETLKRRLLYMAAKSPAEAAAEVDPEDEDQAVQDEARVVHADSQSPRAEKTVVNALLAQITKAFSDPGYLPSKWRVLIDRCLLANGIAPGNGQQAVIFTEYADSAEWIAARLVADGYSSRTYSGRQAHAARDQIRMAFMAGDFQVIVSTDAGNEGIDLQVAHVLVNFDIPWSLVRLEQRMGRIHRVGQTRDVELNNLVATDTREGDTLHTLLENFVTAANDLDGQMFDSLSLVAELAAVSYEEWLQTLYGEDELKKAEVLAAVQRVSATDLKRRAEKARSQEAQLSTGVDAMAGLVRLHQDSLEQLNPAVVEAFLRRLTAAGVLRARPTAAGEGVLLIESATPLPPTLGAGQSALVATTGTALHDSGGSAVPLGPGSPAFTELVDSSAQALSADLFRGGTAEDPTAGGPYELLVFSSTLSSPATRTRTPWSALIRVDTSGDTRHVRWECLANLIPVDMPADRPDPMVAEVAASEARRVLAQMVAEQVQARDTWFSAAKRDLRNLPVDLTLDISDRGERIAMRDRLTASSEQRLAQLSELSKVDAGDLRLTARLRVVPGPDPNTPLRRRADTIAASHVRRLLGASGWTVQDVRAENRGFDLRAVRGHRQQLVAAKGAWRAVDADAPDELSDLRLRGDEVLMAAQHRGDYLLYVVESCQDGLGSLFGAFPDPLDVFTIDLHGEAVAHLSSFDLLAAKAGMSDPLPGQEVQ